MICKPFKCIFVHIPKTAGQSIEQVFMDQLGLGWEAVEDREALLLQDNEDPARGPEKLPHLSASEYVDCGWLSPQDFSEYFRFSFVRNPYTRILSEYRYRNYFSHRSFKDFVFNKLPKPGWSDKYRHVMPQYDMLYNSDGELLVDFIGRFESLQQDFDRVCEQLKIGDSALPHMNKSDKKSRDLKRKVRNMIYMNGENDNRGLEDFYDEETRQAIADYYARDIEAFGYEYPGE